jgi:hypothetical protein
MTQLYVDTLANEAGTGPTELTKQSAAKMYARLVTNATTSNYENFNFSSATDQGTGVVDIDFTNSFNSDGYVPTLGGERTSSTGVNTTNFNRNNTVTGTVRVETYNDSETKNTSEFAMSIFGTLA